MPWQLFLVLFFGTRMPKGKEEMTNIVCACIAAPVALAIIIYTIRAVVKDEREAVRKELE